MKKIHSFPYRMSMHQ